MKGLFIRLNATIKKILGICNSKGCYKKSTTEIFLKGINIKRCVCDEHFLEFLKLDLKDYVENKK